MDKSNKKKVTYFDKLIGQFSIFGIVVLKKVAPIESIGAILINSSTPIVVS